MKTILATSAFLFSFFATSSSAQDDNFPTYMPWGSVLGLVQNVKLELNDEVDDNCWTNPASVRSAAFLKFEQNGIFVPDYEPAFINRITPQVSINAFGFRTAAGVCVVSASFLVEYGASDVLGGANGKERFSFPVTAVIFNNSAVFTNSSNANEQLSDWFDGTISEFIARSISAKRGSEMARYFEVYPPSDERPMSRAEWDEIVKEINSDPAE